MSDDDRVRWARALDVAGWTALVAYLGIVAGLVRRASRTRTASFEDGIWWQRVETVSSATQSQTLIVLVPAVAAAVAGTMIARPVVDRSVLRLRQLVRSTAGTCYVVIVIGLLGIVGMFFRNSDSVGDLVQLLNRSGGILMSYGMIRLCLEAERSG